MILDIILNCKKLDSTSKGCSNSSKKNTITSNKDIGSLKNVTILIVPDFDDFTVKLIIADDSLKYSTEIPILGDVLERQYYGRTATYIGETSTSVRQPAILGSKMNKLCTCESAFLLQSNPQLFIAFI